MVLGLYYYGYGSSFALSGWAVRSDVAMTGEYLRLILPVEV